MAEFNEGAVRGGLIGVYQDLIEQINDSAAALTEQINDSAVVPAAAVADATDAEDIVDQFNALLAALRAAGFVAEEEEEEQ